MLRTTHRNVQVTARFSLLVNDTTTAFLRVRPAEPTAKIDRLTVTDSTGSLLQVASNVELFDGVSQWHDRVTLPAGLSSFVYSAAVDVDNVLDERPQDLAAPRADEMTPDHWKWIQPSRFCLPDELGTEAWAMFGSGVSTHSPATGALVQEVCDFISARMVFAYGSTGPLTTANEAWTQRRGVCRDFAHIAVSFCRSLNIPTRYVFGYIPDIEVEPNGNPQDFCAWFEVLLGNRWWAFDARVNERRIGRIIVGRGRDAADVPMISTLGAAGIDNFSVEVAELSQLSPGPAHQASLR